jgi:hypothetical protein
MSKKLTFRGKMAMGLQERLHLSTNDGLTGYKIKKFQIMSAAPGTAEQELVGKIYTTDQNTSISATVDFSDGDLIAAVISFSRQTALNTVTDQIIIDGEVVNQDLYVTIVDAEGATVECNFYVELEVVDLSLAESTFTTLKNIRAATQ